jgi:hypothetical protein
MRMDVIVTLAMVAAILGTVAVAPAVAPAKAESIEQTQYQPPVDEVQRALREILDLLGIFLPAEEAFLTALAVLIVYGWAAIGGAFSLGLTILYIGGAFLIASGSFLEIFGQMMAIVGDSLSVLLFTGFLWLSFALIGAIIAQNHLGIIGQLLIDISEALRPLEEYFPWP